MSKAILILNEMPECCYDCKFCKFNGGFYNNGYYGRDCLLTGEEVQRDFDITKSRHNSCPLKPLPQKKEIIDIRDNDEDIYEVFANKINVGFNKCIDEILGGE